jgi:hypothetical protein
MLMVIIEGVVTGLAVAVIIAIIHVLHKKVQARRVTRANELAARKAEIQRLAQRRRTRIFSPVGIRIPQGTGVSGSLATSEDPWARTSASLYAGTKRDTLRRHGLTPAGYARGTDHRKPKK